MALFSLEIYQTSARPSLIKLPAGSSQGSGVYPPLVTAVSMLEDWEAASKSGRPSRQPYLMSIKSRRLPLRDSLKRDKLSTSR